jgi:hypothetical protein
MRVMRIPIPDAHDGGARGAPARERRGAKGPRKRPSQGMGRSPIW